jgi:hypothetical protein
MYIAQKLTVNGASQVIYLAYITELLRTVANNLSGFKATVKGQMDQALFPLAREHIVQYLP